ncbi:hypothetical protein DRO69_09840 [Candidatus Bathyarchaeota archaeon]|nr:MAG: hypothetical protein DRO69_09840 [Candidatus Bathyarchaeota archaeon]
MSANPKAWIEKRRERFEFPEPGRTYTINMLRVPERHRLGKYEKWLIFPTLGHALSLWDSQLDFLIDELMGHFGESRWPPQVDIVFEKTPEGYLVPRVVG